MKITAEWDDQEMAEAYLKTWPDQAQALQELYHQLRNKYKYAEVRETTWDEVWELFWEACEGLEL